MILPGIFLEDISGHFCPETNEDKKSGNKIPKKSGGSKNKNKSAKKSVLPKADRKKAGTRTHVPRNKFFGPETQDLVLIGNATRTHCVIAV